jgi:hypothetical protein
MNRLTVFICVLLAAYSSAAAQEKTGSSGKKIPENTCDTNFRYFLEHPEEVNRHYGKNFAENTIIELIAREKITPFSTKKNVLPDWNRIEQTVQNKYGELGIEALSGHRMIYHWSREEWVPFGKFYQMYFLRSMPAGRSFINVNNISWAVYEHVSDSAVLQTAITTMKMLIEIENENYRAIDTYAHLLFKAGRKKEAIQWQEKALSIQPDDVDTKSNLQKMYRDSTLAK